MRYAIALLVFLFVAALVLRVPIVRTSIGLIIASVILFVIAVVGVERIPHPPALTAPPANKADDTLWQVIRPDQITITAQLLKRSVDDPASMDYTATVTNNGDRDADELSLRIRLYDCPAKPTDDFSRCFTIGDRTEQLNVPVRVRGSADFSGRFRFADMREANNVFAWRAEVTKVHATGR